MVTLESGVGRVNGLPAQDAETELLTCCASRRWAAAVTAARPYADRAAVRSAAALALADLHWDDVEEALAAHPRIGERAGARARTGTEAAWSREEQSGVDGAATDVRAALADGNRAYEERFGHVFLICATGLSAAEMLAELTGRLGHDPEAERAVVRAELAKIVDLRVDRLLAGETG